MVTSITFVGVLIYLGAFAFLILLILGQKKNLLKSNDVLWEVSIGFAIYILAFSLTKLVNSGLEDGFNAFVRTCQDFFVFLWVFLFVSKTNKNQDFVKGAILIASVVTLGYGLLQFINLDIFNRQLHIDRISGFHKNPYSYGGQLIVLLFFLLGYYKNSINKIFGLIILTSCVFCILNTSERAVIFGVIFGLLIYFILLGVNKNKKNLISLILLFSIPVILTAIFNINVFKRIKKIFYPQKKAGSNFRLKLWEIAILVWKRNILFGAGKFPQVFHQGTNNLQSEFLTHAHNVYLQILVTNGVVGLLAFIYLFYSILKTSFENIKNNQYAICLIAVILSFVIEGIFEYFWGDSEVRYLLLYFIGFVLGSFKKDR